MDIWISKSSIGKEISLAIVSTIIGLLIVVGLRNFNGLDSNEGAGFLLGILLLGLGAAGLLFSGRQSVIIDPKRQCITIKDSNTFKSYERTIQFNEIIDIGIGHLGKKSNFVTMYYLILKLKNGEDYSLFAPGRFYKGASSRFNVEAWRERLENYIGRNS